MRRPLVVVIVAASALLLAGGIAATTAGAEETSGLPGFSLPGVNWPESGGSGRGGADDKPAGDAGYSGHSGRGNSSVEGAGDQPAAQQPAAKPAQNLAQLPAQKPAQQAAQQPAHQVAAPSVRQAGDRAARVAAPSVRQAGDRAARGQARAVRQRPAQQRPGLAQLHASTLMSAARERVTAVDVSSSPAAPVQRQILALVNQSRRQGGCGVFSVDHRLVDAANDHAADMARRRYFAHNSPNGASAGDRVRGAGYRWARYGENIARGIGSAYDVYQSWMRSPEHRQNIMDCRLRQMGIGLALAGDGTPYWVQDFATPMT